MGEEEEVYAQIIEESRKKLLVLKTLSNFFNHKDLFAVLVRTKVIHNLFENNRQLDCNKLSLFHIQYTSSLIDLFQKLKKSKEQNYSLISDEIYINEDLILKLQQEAEGINFKEETRQQAQRLASNLEHLYKILAADLVAPFSWADMIAFAGKRRAEFYREISLEQYQQLTHAEGRKVYQSPFATIEKKLLGRLNILNFRIKFKCGLAHKNEVVEIYEFIDSNDLFMFIGNSKSLFFLQDTNAKDINLGKNLSHKNAIIEQLINKNQHLKEQLSTIKTALPAEVESVLASYLVKISSVDFLEELQNVDEQTNILKAMLNINNLTR